MSFRNWLSILNLADACVGIQSGCEKRMNRCHISKCDTFQERGRLLSVSHVQTVFCNYCIMNTFVTSYSYLSNTNEALRRDSFWYFLKRTPIPYFSRARRRDAADDPEDVPSERQCEGPVGHHIHLWCILPSHLHARYGYGVSRKSATNIDNVSCLLSLLEQVRRRWHLTAWPKNVKR